MTGIRVRRRGNDARYARLVARRHLLELANRHRIDPGIVKAYTSKSIQSAVCALRRRGLATARELEDAGFRAVER